MTRPLTFTATTVPLPWAKPPLAQNGPRRMRFHAEAKAKADDALVGEDS